MKYEIAGQPYQNELNGAVLNLYQVCLIPNIFGIFAASSPLTQQVVGLRHSPKKTVNTSPFDGCQATLATHAN